MGIFREVDFEYDLYLCDKNFYTLIPAELGLEAMNYWIPKTRHLVPVFKSYKQFSTNVLRTFRV